MASLISSTGPKPHLLLGNGFSRAFNEDIFSYQSLLDSAEFENSSPHVRRLFSDLKTNDFERVIGALNDSSTVLKRYDSKSKKLIKQIKSDGAVLKSLLVKTIAANHPSDPSMLTDNNYKICRSFLSQFNRIYTLNYDLLLYWVLIHKFNGADSIEFDDGFRHPKGQNSADYVSWEIENTNQQSIHYLHGALHLFESKSELKKFTWVRTGVSLLKQAKEAISSGYFPLFVSEGTSQQKMSRIMKSAYLLRGLKSLNSIPNSLVIFGWAMSKNDDHIMKRIEHGKVRQVFVGVYGNPSSSTNRALMARAQLMAERRNSKKNPLTVQFYDASSADTWNKNI